MSQRTMTIDQVRKLAKQKKGNSRTRLKREEYLSRFLATPPATMLSASDQQRQRNIFERHDAAVISLRLPLAPTINNYYMDFVLPGKKHATKVKSAEGNAFFEAVEIFWRRHFEGWPPEPITGRIRLLVVAHMARNGNADLSNRWKALEDALTACGAWNDDSQIDSLRMERGVVVAPTGAMEVIIEVMT